MSKIYCRNEKTSEITEGAIKLCLDLGFAPICEFTLKCGRRADICAINDRGEILIIEVKSGLDDFRADNKWHEYIDYCDYFYFVIDNMFPQEFLPLETGVIIADGFGGAIIRNPTQNPLNPQRRKSLTLLFARAAATKAILQGQKSARCAFGQNALQSPTVHI